MILSGTPGCGLYLTLHSTKRVGIGIIEAFTWILDRLFRQCDADQGLLLCLVQTRRTAGW